MVTIQIFFKMPEPGKVKTRLIPVLGEEGASDFAASMIHRLVSLLQGSGLGETELWYAGDAGDFLASVEGVASHQQKGGDLGERMKEALSIGIYRSDKAILVGTDCPLIDDAYVATAAALLEDHDVVIGPAEDGGYGLIGVRDAMPDVFSGIDWGTDQVLAQTCRRLNESRANYALLPLIWDVDRPEDLPRYYAWLGET